ncbi:MarR family transcriptional regulator [Viridibacillus sp. FSL R5-0477]|uniref:Regulatory protein MarR n=1 Tax=Viridibacillus arenosi FSL R5-213 TaxID=1227360 RepID=W4F6T9_9BACL|nr:MULTISPECIES: MarR family transcriptional regulator [Viridibacillus]ETT88608.1 regulatory protein MarR [Viridibacillus arenosi FSL R5-213]OMC81160.1 MarR family transcriptional regulator [Viridibacillus sp. FSL H8-0123]OMC85087.1 MarR family transcriptional regulator [Viridibacillus sp. FSL H7-0596]OMC90222.1 MarR family transcriptional regulator [Viridibacillus arenosi]
MRDTNIFKLIHAVELVNNANIIRFSQMFPHNIGISPILALSELKINGPQKQTVLADKLGYTPGAMTNIATKLVKNGFAERQYNANDRRHVLLAITEMGSKVLIDAQSKGHDLALELFSVLSEEEVDQYLAIQNKLLKNVAKEEL